jgi:predicted naringenin-chalcone synthase
MVPGGERPKSYPQAIEKRGGPVNTTLKVIFVASVAGLVAGSLAAVVVAAFGWPLIVAAVVAGIGAGAAAARSYGRIRAQAALRRGDTPETGYGRSSSVGSSPAD